MTWVKICGITNLDDAEAAVAAGADALGFVFYDRSPRNVNPAIASAITRQLPVNVETVGVFVDPEPNLMIETAKAAGLKAIQLYQTGLLDPRPERARAQQGGVTGYCVGDLRMYWVLPAAGITWVPSGRRASIAGIFLDSATIDQPGGTGKAFDWNAAKPLVQDMSQDVNVIIAGGLTPANVMEAIRILRPFGVDVSSGVEARPGRKDPEKVRAFIQAVREVDRAA